MRASLDRRDGRILFDTVTEHVEAAISTTGERTTVLTDHGANQAGMNRVGFRRHRDQKKSAVTEGQCNHPQHPDTLHRLSQLTFGNMDAIVSTPQIRCEKSSHLIISRNSWCACLWNSAKRRVIILHDALKRRELAHRCSGFGRPSNRVLKYRLAWNSRPYKYGGQVGKILAIASLYLKSSQISVIRCYLNQSYLLVE